VEDARRRHDAADAELADRLRRIDLSSLHPGLRKRTWDDFCALTGIDPAPARPNQRASMAADPPPAVAADPAPAVATPPSDLAPGTTDLARRLGFARVVPLPARPGPRLVEL